MDTELLRSYESARSQLNYSAAFKVIMAFGINPEWLATGNGHWWLSVPIPSPKELGVGARTPYSKIYEKHLSKTVAETTKEWESRPPPEPIPLRINAADPRERLMAEAKMVNWLKRFILCLPDSNLEAFLNFLYLKGTRLARSYPIDSKTEFEKRIQAMDRVRAQMEAYKKIPDDEQHGAPKYNLTDTASYIKVAEVKPQLPSLLERLNLATMETGKMSALAVFLAVQTKRKVPLASVSRWLSGKREPGGEITLLMQHWVEQQERQK
jgi:hypothetical protein